MPLDVNSAADFDAASAKLLRENVGALLVGSTPINAALREKWNALSSQHRIPKMAESKGIGSTFSYGADVAAIYRRAAEFVAKILSRGNGADPMDLFVDFMALSPRANPDSSLMTLP